MGSGGNGIAGTEEDEQTHSFALEGQRNREFNDLDVKSDAVTHFQVMFLDEYPQYWILLKMGKGFTPRTPR